MAGGVIHAAWVQAIPVWVAAGAAIFGLSTWRKQQRGQRQLEHAEKALAAGREAVALVRVARGGLVQIPPEKAGGLETRRAAVRDIISERLDRAWNAWRRFQEHYELVKLFALADAGRLNVSKEIADCLSDLSGSARLMFWLEDQQPENLAERQQLADFRAEFFGSRDPQTPDPVEQRLCRAEAALDVELRPILRPASWTDRLRRRVWRLAAAAHRVAAAFISCVRR